VAICDRDPVGEIGTQSTYRNYTILIANLRRKRVVANTNRRVGKPESLNLRHGHLGVRAKTSQNLKYAGLAGKRRPDCVSRQSLFLALALDFGTKQLRRTHADRIQRQLNRRRTIIPKIPGHLA